MLKVLKDLRTIQRKFELDDSGKFKRLKFPFKNEKVDLTGKSIEELHVYEIIKLKKYSSSFIEEAFGELEKQKILEYP